MATSGSTDFNMTATELIRSAMRTLGVIGVGAVPTDQELADGLESLNMMIKAWQTDGIQLWLHTEAALFLVEGQEKYSLPGANVAKLDSLTETTLAADAAASATSITVSSIAGIADTKSIGIVTDSNTIHWTTVSGAPSGSSVTLATGMAAAASSGNKVWVYSGTIERPNRITDMRRRNAGIDTPVTQLLGRQDYFMLPNKTDKGVPVQAYYDPQTNVGTLYVWPAPTTVDDHMRFTYSRPIQDVDSLTNTLDFPTEWLKAIKYNLAVDMAPEYGLRPFPEVIAQATNTKEALNGWDRELQPIQFEPEEY